MQPNRQYNQTQTYGVYFPQSSAQGYQHQAVAAPAYQSYGSGPAQFVQGQPVFSVKPLYPPPIPYQPNIAQNYRGQALIGPPPAKPFPEQHLQPPPQFNQIGPRPPTPPQAPALFTPPGNQGPPNQYNWSTSVTPPSPYYNNESFNAIESELESLFEGASPVQPCSVPLPPRLKMLGQYVQQSQNAVPELNNSFSGNQIAANDVSKFSPDPSTSGKAASPGNDNKNVFKQKAFQHGISLESPPKPDEIESVNYSNSCSKRKNKNTKNIGKTDAAKSANIINSSKTGKRPRDEDVESKAPLTLPAKTVAERNLGKQKLRDDWWSVSDTSNLSGNNSVSRDDSNAFSVALNDNKEFPDLSAYSSFPDSSVDISKVLADSSINTSVDSKSGEVFDDSVDYIEEHEFLSYDVTSSPFPLYDSENDDTDTESVGHEAMPENPIPQSQSVSNDIKKELKAISLSGTKDENDNLKSDNEKILQRFQMELKQSENKKAELLDSGIKSDENIEMLASAIVNVVLAKAVIDVISSKEMDEKDMVENERIVFQDTEASEDLNQNTNAETKQVISKAEEICENSETDHKLNYRQRLYSWPYTTDSDIKVKCVKENNVEKQAGIDGPQSLAKDIVEIIVEPSKTPEKKELEPAKIVKTAKESAEDFEKYYFKQKASQHGIDIVSPRCQLKRASSLSSESENESEKAIQKGGIPKQNFIRSTKKGLNSSFDQQSRSQSESSDIHSLDESDSQVDPSHIFRQNASRCGIKIQNPKETIELSTENSDAELESYAFQNKVLQLDDPKRCDTSTPEPDKLSLNPESPEFKPGWKKKLENNQRTSSSNGMRADAPAFNPGSLNTSSSDLNDSLSKIEMRVDAPEFNPSSFSVRANVSSFEPQTKTEETATRTAKVFHIPTPKVKQEKPAVGIQASPQTCDSSANTRRVKMKESGMETASCYSREVSVNTDFPGNLVKESHTLPVKSKSFASKNTNTDVPKRRSIAVSVNFSGGYQDSKPDDRQKLENAILLEREQAEMIEQMKTLQIEVMKHRANLHVTRIFLMEQKIQKEATLLIESLKFSQDKRASDAIWSVVDAKLNMLEATVRKINSVADDTMDKIRAGYVFKTLPDFTFFSDDVEQNRVIANKQLYEIASGNPPQDTLSQIKIDFSPTNRNVIEFTAKSKTQGGKTEKIDFSTTNRKQIIAESKSPGDRPPDKINFSPTHRNLVRLVEFTAKSKSPGGRTPAKGNRSPAKKRSPLAPVSTVKGSDKLVSETQSPMKEEEVSRGAGVTNPADRKAEEELVKRPEGGGSLMDLDLDSDDEITEVSTALVDYDEDLSLNDQPDVGGPEPEYAGSKDLKNLISSKMTEVYGEFSETTDIDSGANEELTTSMNDSENEIENTDRIQTSMTDTGIENENLVETDHSAVPSQTPESEKSVVVQEQSSEYDDIKLIQESIQELDILKKETETNLSGEVSDRIERTDEKVPDNWENLELDLTEVYKSPEVHPNLENLAKDDLNAPQKLPAQEGADSVALISDEQTVKDVTGKDKAVAPDLADSVVVTSIPSSNELRVKPEIQASESVTMSLNSVVTSTSTVVTVSSASLVSSVANAVPPLMSLMQSSGNNVMAQPMLMNSLNPMLYQLVVAQLVKAYPALAANPDMLSSVSLQQASLLQHYMVTGQISSANIAEALQGSMSDNVEPGAMGIGTQIPNSNANDVQNNFASANERNPSSVNTAAISGNGSVSGMIEDIDRKDKTSEVVNDTSVPSKTKPPPYRPPGLRGDPVTSPSNSMFQSARTNKLETEAATTSQNPFSAVKSQSIPVKTLESIHTAANVPSLSRPNSNNSASKLSDLSKPLRRPFKQYMSTSKSMDSITPSSNVVYDSIPNSASASGLSDFSEPLRRPFKQSLSESKPTSNVPIVSSSMPSRVQTGVNSSQSFSDTKTGIPPGRPHDSSNKPPDFLPQYAKRHSPELRDKKEVPSSDFLPSFVRQASDEGKNYSDNVNKPASGPTQSLATPTENQQNFQRQLPPRFRNLSAPQRQSSNEEDWDEEIEEFPETKTMKVNPKRELHLRSSSSRKPVPTDVLLTSSKLKNDSADSTNPFFQRSTSFPSEFKEGTSGLSDIPLPKKLRTSEEETKKGGEGEKEEEEWCEVTTKKKKQKELKRYTAPYVNSAPVQSQAEKQQKQSNFERLIEKIQEKCPTASRSEAIDSVTKLREQRGGNLKNIGLHEIVNQATSFIQQQAKPTKGGNPHIPGLWPSQRSSTPPKLMSLPIVNPSINSSLMPRDDEEICVICHDPLSYEETKALDCKHVFHSNCINQWVYGRERTCPTCRQHALFPEEFPRLGK